MSDQFSEELTPNEEPEENDLETSEDFEERYGFTHQCTCAEDWASGNLGVVAVCYLNMCRDALDVLAKTREELAAKEEELAELRIQAAE